MQKNLSDRKFAESIGMSGPGYKGMLDNRTCSIETIELICKTYNVSLSYFFDEPGNQFNEPAVKYGNCKECAKKDVLIEELRREIKSQKEDIAMLNREVGRNLPGERAKVG